MIRKFKLILEYDGAAFCGWQTQPGVRTIQAHLEEKMESIFKRRVHCHASGRTDSGVHALGQVAHFKADTHLKPAIIHKALNSFLDPDLAVLRVQEVGDDFDAQHSASGKTYRYTILNRAYPSALWRDRAYLCVDKLNVTAMRRAALHLKGKHDFKAFQSASQASKKYKTVRTVYELAIAKQGDLIHITVSADGFLYKMVRNIVGTLIAVGRGRLAPGEVLKLLQSRDRRLSPKPVPSCGLCLIEVYY